MIRNERQAHMALLDTLHPGWQVGNTWHIPAPRRPRPSMVRWLLQLIGA